MLTEEQIQEEEAKTKKIMDEPSLDEVWEDTTLDDDKEEEKEDEQEEEQQEKEEKKPSEEEEKEEKPDEEEEEEEEKKEPENKIDWKALGFDKFGGKSDQEVVEQIKFERQQLGHTVNMLGDLRRENADLRNKQVPPKKEEVPKKKDILSSIPELDDADAAKFNAMYEKNPIKAIMAYGGDTIKQMVADEVKSKVPKEAVGEIKEEIAYNSFLNNAKPTDVEVEQMKIFDDPQYLGTQKRSYGDLHNLSKMWLSEDEDIVAIRDNVYGLMIKHPTMSFDEARGYFAPKEEKKVPTVDKEKIKQTIIKNKKVESHPKKKAKALPSSDLSFDDAWDEA